MVDRLRRLQLEQRRRRLQPVALRMAGFRRLHDLFRRNACGRVLDDRRPPRDVAATARALQVASHFVRDGERMLGLSKTGLPRVRAYASTYDGGFALMLFNLSKTEGSVVPVKIAGRSSGSGGEIVTYDKALYDASKQNVWKGPIVKKLPPWSGGFSVTLPPWSIVTVQTK